MSLINLDDNYPFFQPSDFFFATTLLKSEKKTPSHFFLSYLFAASRDGHLCIEVSPEKITPMLSQVPCSFLELLQEARNEIPVTLCQKITDLQEEVSSPVIEYKNRYYLQKNWIFEQKILSFLQALQKEKASLPIDEKRAISYLCKNQKLSEAQKKAILFCVKKPVTFLLGGPGTGKTHIASHLAELSLQCSNKELSIAFLAPTGKALANMQKRVAFSESKVSFFTLHSFLSLGSLHSHRKKKKRDFDLLIIDEASMLDAKMLAALFSSLSNNSSLLFMGDPNQLPPIEQGTLLQDIFHYFPNLCWEIHENFRSVSQLHQLASSVLQGDGSQLTKILTPLSKKSWEEELHAAVEEHLWEYAEKPEVAFLLAQSKKSILLTPMKRGIFGADFLNQWIGRKIWKKSRKEYWRAFPILITKNEASKQLFNGMEGIMLVPPFKDLFHPANEVFLEKDISFSLGSIPSFSLLYLLSIHKSQGSEYEKVTLLLPKGSDCFGKELLYTGITRAKKMLSILGDESTLHSILSQSMRKESGFGVKCQP